MKTFFRALAAGAIAASALFARPAFADDKDLLARIDRKLLPESYESYRQIIDEYPDGRKKEFTVYSIKKGSDKTALLFLAPASEKGRSTLRLGDNMWLLIPNVGKPVRITSLQSVTGGVFNNADIMQIEYGSEYDVEKSERDGDGYILDLRAKSKSVAYDRLRMWASAADIVTKIECYSSGGMLIKTLEFKNIKDFGHGLVRPSVIETYSPCTRATNRAWSSPRSRRGISATRSSPSITCPRSAA